MASDMVSDEVTPHQEAAGVRGKLSSSELLAFMQSRLSLQVGLQRELTGHLGQLVSQASECFDSRMRWL